MEGRDEDHSGPYYWSSWRSYWYDHPYSEPPPWIESSGYPGTYSTSIDLAQSVNPSLAPESTFPVWFTSTRRASATRNGTNAYASASSVQPSQTAVAHHNYEQHSLSTGPLAAAIILPIAFLSLLAALIFLLLRRRRRRRNNQTHLPPPKPPPSSPPPMTRRRPSLRSPPNPGSMPLAPIITSSRNNAYYTGLDTSSHGGSEGSDRHSDDDFYAPARRSEGGTFLEPPPPYKASGSLRSTDEGYEEEEPPPGIYDLPRIGEPAVLEQRARSPFEDQEDYIPVADGLMYTPMNGGDARDVRQSRVSLRRSPFEDPDSPVSDIGGRFEDVDVGARNDGNGLERR